MLKFLERFLEGYLCSLGGALLGGALTWAAFLAGLS